MAQTSIHICPVKGGSELHNERRKELDYVRKELTSQNQTWKSPDFPGINEQHAKIAADYQAAHGKKMHAKATPIREAVVVIQENTTMQQLRTACAKCREQFGIETMQIYIHKDEGHTEKDGTWKANLHAHIVFNWYDTRTHTTYKLSRQDMADMQTLFAECLQMERGVSSDRKHLNAIQQKNLSESVKLQNMLSEVAEIDQQITRALRDNSENLEVTGRNMVKEFDYIAKQVTPTTKEQEARDNLEKECQRQVEDDKKKLREHNYYLYLYIIRAAKAVHALTVRLAKEAVAARRALASAARKNKILKFLVPAADIKEVATIDDMQAKVDKATAEKDAALDAQIKAELQKREAIAAKESAERALATAKEDAARPWQEKCGVLQQKVNSYSQRLKDAEASQEIEIDQARAAGYNAGAADKQKEWLQWYNKKVKPAIAERDSLRQEVTELNTTKAKWVKDCQTIAKTLTGLSAESIQLLEKIGIRESIGADIWDKAKAQHKKQASQNKPRGPHF